jgi:hypothetical protein
MRGPALKWTIGDEGYGWVAMDRRAFVDGTRMFRLEHPTRSGVTCGRNLDHRRPGS